MTKIFNPKLRKVNGVLPPFGGKKMIFLGDPAQLRPVAGEPIDTQGSSLPLAADRRHGARGVRQSRYHRSARGQELYRKFLRPNCIWLEHGQRNGGLLQMIADRIRNGEQTDDDLVKLTAQRHRFPNVQADYGIHYTNEACTLHNWEQAWAECKGTDPPRRLYVAKASYETTSDNQPVVDWLSSLPAKDFGFAADVLPLCLGADVRLIRNVNVGAGLVNSALGKVVAVMYDNGDVPALRANKHPPPYCIVVDFPGFQGFVDPLDPRGRSSPFPMQPTWVPIFRTKFVPEAKNLPKFVRNKQRPSQCYRLQFPLDLAR